MALAVLDSVFGRKGYTFSVEISRQGGKNELSAQLELLLLTLFIAEPKNIIKCAPTFKPQLMISMMRLKSMLENAGFGGIYKTEQGYIIKLGDARAIFLSAEETANVVGNTAGILLEIDESQDVSKEKYSKDFKPMGASTNVTTVHYGTAWDGNTLLEDVKQHNLEQERRDGIKRHFRYDWQEVAKYNSAYADYVAGEKARLGEDHPLFVTQYLLTPINGGGGLFKYDQKAQLKGSHPRKRHPEPNKIYVASVDIAGEAEIAEDAVLRSLKPQKDSTVVTIGEISASSLSKNEPEIKIVEHYWWTGKKHTELYAKLADILGRVWKCRRITVDSTGIGQTVASFLRAELGSKVIPFTFTAQSKTKLGFDLLAAVNSGNLKMYEADNSPECREFWLQIEKARYHMRSNQTMSFDVNPAEGHDDFLMSLALLVHAGKNIKIRGAKGR